MMHRPLTRVLAAGLALSLIAAGCSDDDDPEAERDTTTTEAPADGAAPVLSDEDATTAATTYADVVFAAYDDTVTAATELQTAITAFTEAPTDETLTAARETWLSARDLYGPTEVFRFYDGPIDAPETGPEGQINAWPLDEAYIDQIIADESVTEITADVLVEANEQGGEANISTGWHAIEYLLWGADESTDGPGDRPVTDYTTAPEAERRATYLTELAQLLVDDLTSVRDQWDPEAGAYREEFLAEPQTAIGHIFRGMGALSAGELAGERILVAYDTQDQEDEHSCFSDNTTADVAGNAIGIRLAYTGEWPGVEGTSLSEIVAAVEPELDEALRAQLDATVAAAEGLEGPFDQLIVGAEEAPGRESLRTLAEDLQAQGDSIAELATALGYEISLDI